MSLLFDFTVNLAFILGKQELKKLRVLEAANDIDVGDVAWTAGRLKSSRLTKGNVLFAGTGGLITEQADGGFSYSPSKAGSSPSKVGLLSVPSIRVSSVASDVDMQGNILK